MTITLDEKVKPTTSDPSSTAVLPHPQQPIGLSSTGTIRFKKNNIIDWLFNSGKLDLNRICVMVQRGTFPKEDYVQLTQLLGYSVSGWCGLSTTPPDLAAQADARAAEICELLKESKD
tara:strand:- start:634 stop:987 length:354 start_codon:yes stop_codon:yes gene_type:complete